jgi:hypothetical protein
MMTRKDDIKGNEIEVANFREAGINPKFAKQIADDLRSNKSIKSFDFSGSSLNDESFGIICESIIARNIKVNDLNLDFTKISKSSLKTIKTLIDKGLISRINMFWLEDFHENENLRNQLSTCARNKDVVLSFDVSPEKPTLPSDKEIIEFYKREEKQNGDEHEERKDYRPR